MEILRGREQSGRQKLVGLVIDRVEHRTGTADYFRIRALPLLKEA
jgi:hypothetical protein